MRKILLLFLAIGSQLNLIEAQISNQNEIDSLVAHAISRSEKSLYNARFKEAKEYVQCTNFMASTGFNDEHKIMLTVQDFKIERIKNIVYHLKANPNKHLDRLNKLFINAQNAKEKDVQGSYFLALSYAQRLVGNIDSALIYEELAIKIFHKTKNFEKIARIRASRISRLQNQLFREGRKDSIIALIPEYEEEIKFSAKHSPYALGYNLRHLAQIHFRQTLNYNKALSLFQRSLWIRIEIGFKPFIPASYSSLGDVYIKLEDYKSAVEMYLKAAELAEEIGFVRYQSYPYLRIGDHYLNQNNIEAARECYLKAFENATKNNYTAAIKEAMEKIRMLEN